MRSTKIVTSFIKYNDKFLLLKRSKNVKSMKRLWAGVSGMIEKNETPLQRAQIEIHEEIGILTSEIKLVKTAEMITVESIQYMNHQWMIFPFLFVSIHNNIQLNWENSAFIWINADQLSKYNTVPHLDKVLSSLL